MRNRVREAVTEIGGPVVPDRSMEPSVERAKAGDQLAFERLYHHYVNRIYGLCLRMTGDQDRAERLVQDTFVTAWRKLGTFRGESAFSTWLHKIAVNAVLQDQRSRKRARERRMLHGETNSPLTTPPSPDGLRIDLARAIATLPDGARMVFVLHDVEGYSHREIAEMTGIAEGTSKAQLHRARKLLKGVLQDGS